MDGWGLYLSCDGRPLEFKGAAEAERRMAALAVVEDLNEVEQLPHRIGLAFEFFAEFSEYFKVYDTAGILRYKHQTTTLYNLE